MKSKKSNRPTARRRAAKPNCQIASSQQETAQKKELMRMLGGIVATVEVHYGATRSDGFEAVAVELKHQLERRIGELLHDGQFTFTIKGEAVCPNVRSVAVNRL